MSKHLIFRAFLVAALFACSVPYVSAQTDRDVKAKQSDLKLEYNDAQEKNQIIRSAAQDKPRATTGRRRGSATTGYDYTQVKGFTLRDYQDRIDNVFARANDLGIFDEEYRPDGTFDVPNRAGKGSTQMRKVDVFYVEATPEEQDLYGIEPFEIIEIYVEKLETLPPEDVGIDAGDDDQSFLLGMGTGGGEPIAKGFSLAGTDLLSVLQLVDEPLYVDILSKRSQSMSIPLPERGDWMPGKVGPFIVMTQRELETTTSRFTDFWNKRDTLAGAVHVPQYDAAGPFYELQIPVLYPDYRRIRIRNPEPRPIMITNIQFVGPDADKFELRAKFPIQLDQRGGATQQVDVEFGYIGDSPYETRAQLVVEAREAGLQQAIEVVANPGLYPSDVMIIDASLDRIELRSPARSPIAPNWKMTYTIGNDEINMPRWSTGISTLTVGFKNQMSVGIVLPMNMLANDLPTPLAFNKGILSASSGYNMSFDFAFGFPFALGGSLTVLNDFDAEKAYDHLKVINVRPEEGEEDYFNDFFSIGTIAQIYYPIMFKDRATNPNVAFRLNIGGAYMRIQRNHLVTDEDVALGTVKMQRSFRENEIGRMVTLGKENDVMDVYVRMSFINLGSANNYGMGIQYFAGRMMADAFLELTEWLRVEAKYSFLLREREVWESENTYFLITPRLRIGLPSIFN